MLLQSCVCENTNGRACRYVHTCGTLPVFAGMCRSTHVAVGPILRRAVTPAAQQTAFAPRLFFTAGNKERRFIVSIN